MKMKKLLSGITALAMSVSVFAGLTMTASAAEEAAATVKMTYVDYSNADTSYGEIASGETAKAGYNKISGGSVAMANSNWGCNWITYLMVDASAVEGTITKATLTADVSGSTDSKRKSIVEVGYNSSVWSGTMTYNTADKTITTCGSTASTSSTSSATFNSLSWDISDVLINDDDKISTIIMYATNAAGCYIKNPVVTVEYVEAGTTLYDVTFTETNGISAKVLIDGEDVTNGTSLTAGSYSYTAMPTASGYKPYSGTFTVEADTNVTFTLESLRTLSYTGLDQISPLGSFTAETSKTVSSIVKTQESGQTLVYEFDIYVPANTTSAITYFNGSYQGTTYQFADDGSKTSVQYQTSSAGANNINANVAYAQYTTGALAHCKIETAVTATGLGNSNVYISAVDDAAAFGNRTLTNNTSSAGRVIGPRNLSAKYLNKITYTGSGFIANECMYTKASNVTVNAAESSVSGIESGLIANNTYTVTVTPNDGYTVSSVSVDSEALTATEDGTYTITIDGDTVIDVVTAVAETPAAAYTAEVDKVDTYEGDDDSFAAAYITTITNTGDAEGTPASVTYTVNEKAQSPWSIGVPISLASGAQMKVGLVVSGLTALDQSVTVTAVAE